jgi:hypothetical protein
MNKARTTIMIDADLLKEAKRAAVEREVTLSSLIEDSIRVGIQGSNDDALAKLEEHFAWADANKLKSKDGPLTREQAHER